MKSTAFNHPEYYKPENGTECIDDEERNQSLDDLHDYASGNDLKRALGHPELQKERELPKAPADTQQAESEDKE